jgi:hypothetical protein
LHRFFIEVEDLQNSDSAITEKMAIDSFARSENEKRLKANPNSKPIVGF